MPVQWLAGFETGDTSEMHSVTSSMLISGAYARNGNCGCRLALPQSVEAVAIGLGNGYDGNGYPLTSLRNTYTVGTALRIVNLPPTPNNWEHLLWIGSSTTHRASLRLGADGTIRLHVGAAGSGVIASLAAGTLNRWRYHELAVLASSTVWRVDGQVVFQGAATPGGTMNVAYWGKRYNLAGQGYTVDVDDLYTADDVTLLGPTARVLRLAPAGVSSAGWTEFPPD